MSLVQFSKLQGAITRQTRDYRRKPPVLERKLPPARHFPWTESPKNCILRITSDIPPRGCSSVDRVLASEAKGRGFDPRQPHHQIKDLEGFSGSGLLIQDSAHLRVPVVYPDFVMSSCLNQHHNTL